MIAQDNLARAAANTVTKARPEIERGLGQEVLNMATQSPQSTPLAQAVPQRTPISTIGPGITDSITGQQTQGRIYGTGGEYLQGWGKGQGMIPAERGPGIMDKLGSTIRSEGRMGTDKAGKGFGNDLYKFIQSIGYGMIDKPLDREANTWDYLGKTVGQIARLNEGSGLGAGQQIYNNDTTVQSTTFKRDLLDPSVEEAISSNNPETKIKKYRELLTKYPFARAVLADLFGYSRNYSVDADEQINNLLKNMKK